MISTQNKGLIYFYAYGWGFTISLLKFGSPIVQVRSWPGQTNV